MKDTEKIIKLSRYIILSGCSCFFIYLGFLSVSYFYEIDRVNRQIEVNTFPKLAELINHRIELFFKPSINGLSLLSETLDWQQIMRRAVSDPKWLKSHMKSWAKELEIISVGVSDRDRRIVWDYWSDNPIILDPAQARDAWFFDFWRKKIKQEWSLTIYTEDSAKDYQLYIDRLIRDRNGRPIGSIAALTSFARLREQLAQIISIGERIIILDELGNALIDISRLEIGEGVKVFSFKNSTVQEKRQNPVDMLINKIMSEDSDYGRLKDDDEAIYYKRIPLFNGAMSILAVMDTSYKLRDEKDRLIKNLIVLFISFSLFIGGMLFTMILFSQRLKFLAIKLRTDKSKFEDLLFIITHGFANEILLLQKDIKGVPLGFVSGIDLRLREMSLMIQNSVNAARLDGSKALTIMQPYNFSWQWEKLTGNFKPLSIGKGQKFSASPAIDCIINNDEEMVYQVLANLVSNAVKYTPREGVVRLNAWREGDVLSITVGDSGPGFTAQDRDELFYKFKKLSAKPSGGERSTGLGLYIVKLIADECGIKLTLSQGENELCGAIWKLELKMVQSGM